MKIKRTDKEKKNYNSRINRIVGQLNGIKKMLEEDRECEEIIIQIAAINKAIKSLGHEILENHVQNCIENKNPKTIQEVVNLYRKLG